MNNKELIKRYPFLLPRNYFTGEVVEDYDYSYTLLDDVPDGWRKRFGIEMCEELRENLLKANFLEEYRVVQIKEKFATLRWYDNGVPKKIYDEHWRIISKYEELSLHTCIECGDEAHYISKGYVMPFCAGCAGSNLQNYKPLNEYLYVNIV